MANLDAIDDGCGEPEAATLGTKIRRARLARGYGVREFARRLDCSASLISQIERDRANPSVNTLYAIASELGISIDSMFEIDGKEQRKRYSMNSRDSIVAFRSPATADTRKSHYGSTVQHKESRLVINLDHGVHWELLTPNPEHNNEFMEVTYPAGSSSAAKKEFIRHNGREYALILDGALHARVGADEFVLKPGDSLTFDSTTPHRFWNQGSGPVRAVWFVLNRWTSSE